MYNPLTDFVGLWRNNGTDVSKLEMPGLDFVISALGRAGVIIVTASATAPGTNQTTTAWLQTASPSWNAEGAFFLWDAAASAYAAATPSLFYQFLQANYGASSISWWTSTGGAPANTIGHDGDFAIRLDSPFGIYGPKANGAWPTTHIPGSANLIESSALDNAFGSAPGDLLFRGADEWQVLPIGAADALLAVIGGFATWTDISSLLDAVFDPPQGSVLYRSAAAWAALAPGAANLVLTSQGAGADPAWTNKTAEFGSGTSMVFRQSSAPVGWTKDTSVNDYGLRVVSGSVGTTTGTAFSTVFSQTSVGNTILNVGQMPSHTHSNNANSAVPVPTGAQQGGSFSVPFYGGATISANGDDQPHNHDIALNLAYTDVIIATKN